MKKTLSFIFVIILFSQLCNAQAPAAKSDTAPTNEFYNAEFKWKILIPTGFDTVSSKVYAALQKVGTDELQKTTNSTIEMTATRICAYKSQFLDYFESNKEIFDPKTDGSFFLHCKENDDYIYKTYESQVYKSALIDTTVSNEKIDGLVFQKFGLQILIDKKAILHMYVYSKLFDKKEFTFVIVYANKAKGDLILDAWRNSKFEIN